MQEIKNTPLVCVCVPAYNSEKTLPATLDSILEQTYRNLTVLVVDNASTDATAGIADSYAARDARVRVERCAENVGGEGNFTRCLQLASGDYTAIYHSDDVYEPAMVEEQVAFLEAHPEAGAVFAMAQSIDERGTPGRIYRLPPELRRDSPALYGFDEIFRAVLKHGNFFFCPGVMARTPVYRDHIRVWDASGFNTSADLDVWLRILKRWPVGIIDKPLLKYRISPSSFSFYAARGKTGPHDLLKVLEAYLKDLDGNSAWDAARTDYSFLVMKDNINRAFNLLIGEKRSEARSLLKGIFAPARLLGALKSFPRFKTVLYGCLVFSLSLFPMGDILKKFLFRARFN